MICRVRRKYLVCDGTLILVWRRHSRREKKRKKVLGADRASATTPQGRSLTKFDSNGLETHGIQ
jgi:hypothetical protein